MPLSKALREERDSLAQREGDLRWAWGDWAVKVAGPPGEVGPHDGSGLALEQARLDGADSDLTILVPEVWLLQDYRTAAAAIPPKLRKTVRSIEAGKHLGRRVKDVRERHLLIQKLTNNNGIVTADAVRRHFKIGETNTGRIELLLKPQSPEEEARQAEALMSKPDVARKTISRLLRSGGAAGRAIEKAVETEKRDRFKRDAEERAARDHRQAVPFPAHMARMILTMGDWAGTLAGFYDDLDTLPPSAQRDQVGKTARQLEHQARRWADKIEEIDRRELDEDIAIEGTATDIP